MLFFLKQSTLEPELGSNVFGTRKKCAVVILIFNPDYYKIVLGLAQESCAIFLLFLQACFNVLGMTTALPDGRPVD